jgi:hypothetical protein
LGGPPPWFFISVDSKGSSSALFSRTFTSVDSKGTYIGTRIESTGRTALQENSVPGGQSKNASKSWRHTAMDLALQKKRQDDLGAFLPGSEFTSRLDSSQHKSGG